MNRRRKQSKRRNQPTANTDHVSEPNAAKPTHSRLEVFNHLSAVVLGFIGIAIALVFGIYNYQQNERTLQQVDRIAKEESSNERFPYVKLVIAGQHHRPTEVEVDVVELMGRDLGTIRNFGAGTAFQISGSWLDENGKDLGEVVIKPMTDLAPKEIASIHRLPAVFFDHIDEKFDVKGTIKFEYVDQDGHRHASESPFLLQNNPGTENGFKTVLNFSPDNFDIAKHVHLR